MLDNLELEIVKECRVPSTGAYLQGAFIIYPALIRETKTHNYPNRERLEHHTRRTDNLRQEFDITYIRDETYFNNSNKETHPLKLEREAWTLLSPFVKNHVDKFKEYVEDYTPPPKDNQVLLDFLNDIWSLFKDWNIISESYKAKFEERWNDLPEKEKDLTRLISRLSGRVNTAFHQ